MLYLDLFEALDTVVRSTLDRYRPSLSSFDFENQPHQESDRAYRLTLARDRTEGYMGGSQAEVYRAEVWLTRRINRNPHQAESDLRSDVLTLEDGLLADTGADYNVVDDGTTTELSSPGPDTEYIVARLSFQVDVERTPNQ